MKILVVEPELSLHDFYKQSLANLSEENSVFCVKDFSELKNLKSNEVESESESTEDTKFNLLILNDTLYKTEKWPEELKSIKSQFGEDICICLTCYEDKPNKREEMQEWGIYNIFFKPFDELFFKESVRMALAREKKIQTEEIKPQQATAFVAILKEIEISSISEIGFVSLSDAPIQIGSTTRYFSNIFSHEKKQSVWAQCLVSLAHPKKESVFINKFHFVGSTLEFRQEIRQYVKRNIGKKLKHSIWRSKKSENQSGHTDFKITVVTTDAIELKSTQELLQDNFQNVKVLDFQTYIKSEENLAELKNCRYVINFSDEKLDILKKYFSDDVTFFKIAKNIVPDDQMKKLTTEYKDIWYWPLEKYFFIRKIGIQIPELMRDEADEIIDVVTDTKVKAINHVKVSELCELYINIEYHRNIGVGAFREFVFVYDDENDVIELPAFCHYSAKSSDGKSFLHQFVFWGMTDHYLKQIRLWLRHNYILEKSKEGS